jgi:integral membrane protein
MTQETNKETLNWLIKTGLAEGISFLVLLCIAMPLKYMMHMPTPVRIVGMLHGALFIAFVWMLLKAKAEYKWPLSVVFIGLLLSVLPFGTFFLHRILEKQN